MTIVTPAYTKPGGWKTFFLKRIIRIVPLYYTLSAINAFIRGYLNHQILSFGTVIKSIIFFPFFDTNKFAAPLISVGWSLSYEMYFYTIIGILLMFEKKFIKDYY